MRYTHVVFAQPALEKLQDSLKKSASRRDTHEAEPGQEKAEEEASRRGGSREGGGGLMKSAYQIIQQAGDHRKRAGD